MMMKRSKIKKEIGNNEDNKRPREGGSRKTATLFLVAYLEEVLGTGEQSGGQPHELPATFLTQSVPIVRQLFHDLTVDLVP